MDQRSNRRARKEGQGNRGALPGAVDTELGKKIYFCQLSMGGRKTPLQWHKLLASLCKVMGMTPADSPAKWEYPVGGKGGNGFTFCQPITDSFIVLDTWPDHRGAYLFISSCKPFVVGKALDLLETRKLRIREVQSGEMGLTDA